MKPLVFISGPYSGGDQVLNVRNAIEAGLDVEQCGAAAFVPHLTLLWHLVAPAPYERWIERDNELLVRCDAVYRIDGRSPGADAEVKLAGELRKPVFTQLTDLRRWLLETHGIGQTGGDE